MISINYRGRLGNNLFQFFLAKIISTQNGFEIKSNKNPFSLPGNKGKIYNTPIDIIEGHKINLNSLINPTPRHIRLNGFFQRYEYYAPFKQQILDWFPPIPPTILPERNSVTLHVRGIDNWVDSPHPYYAPTPYFFYNEILNAKTYSKIYVVTNNPKDPIVKKLSDNWDVTTIHSSPEEDFNFIRSSYEIALSVSTFSWWAAWLSKASTVFYPQMGTFHPEIEKFEPNYTNLIVDEPRYRYLDLGNWKWTNSELQQKYMFNDTFIPHP